MSPTGSLHNDEYRQFIGRLREVRKRLGMSQQEVADAMGKSQRWMSYCERGSRRIDAIEFRDFCRVYDLCPNDLIDGFRES